MVRGWEGGEKMHGEGLGGREGRRCMVRGWEGGRGEDGEGLGGREGRRW